MIERLKRYILRRKIAHGLDIEFIHGFDLNCDSEAILLLSDLEAVVAENQRLRKFLEKSAEDARNEGISGFAEEIDRVLAESIK